MGRTDVKENLFKKGVDGDYEVLWFLTAEKYEERLKSLYKSDPIKFLSTLYDEMARVKQYPEFYIEIPFIEVNGSKLYVIADSPAPFGIVRACISMEDLSSIVLPVLADRGFTYNLHIFPMGDLSLTIGVGQ